MPETDAAKAETAKPQFESSSWDQGLDVNNLPPAPWTKAKLGRDLFNKLSAITGASTPTAKSLSPRSFGHSRAVVIIQRRGLDRPIDDDEAAEAARQEKVKAILAEGDRLQAAIDATLPPIKGKGRDPRAMPRGDKRGLTVKKRVF